MSISSCSLTKPNATYGGAGDNWTNNAGTWRWRVRKTSAGAAVGFGLATTTSSGLVGTGTQSFARDKTFTGNLTVGSSKMTVNATTGAGAFSGFTSLGNDSDHPPIKIKRIFKPSGTWATGTSANIPHGLTASTIIGMTISLKGDTSGEYYFPGGIQSGGTGYYQAYYNATNVVIYGLGTWGDDHNDLSILIFYIE